jgi:ribosomal-protein-alanine N-acetyltransferase
MTISFSSTPPMPELDYHGERIVMRSPRLSDSRQWCDVRGRNQAFLTPFEPTWPEGCLSDDFYRRRFRVQAKEWHADRANYFLIFKKNGDDDREGGELIGGMNINNICRGAAQYAALGYWVDEAHEGQGYMRDAMALTVPYCFGILKLHRVQAACLADNTRSQALLRSAGFAEEGRAAHYMRVNGEWQDHILFGLPIESWKP